MGVAGHDGSLVLPGLTQQDLLKIENLADDGADFFFQMQPQIYRNLIVPAAGGVQTLASLADALGQQRLNIHMDIFLIGGKFQLSCLYILQNRLQSLLNRGGILCADDAAVGQHGGVGHRAGDILPVHPGVKADGGVKIVYQCVGFLLKPSGP